MDRIKAEIWRTDTLVLLTQEITTRVTIRTLGLCWGS